MKSKFSRILAIVLAFSMLICCFSACGGKEDDETTTKPPVLGPTDDDLAGWATDDTPSAGDSFGDTSNDTLNNSGSSNNSWGNGSYNNGGSSSGGTYWPDYNAGSTGNSGSSNNNSSTQSPDLMGTIEDEVTHFFTHFDTPEEQLAVLRLAGYEYDESQDIFYTHLNPWQRYFGFADVYDQAAPLTNMWYLTLKVDFEYGDFLWRLQWWKGQYGILEGAELGVYTKHPDDELGPFYECAADDQLLKMTFDYYHSASDYSKGNILFTRAEQEHWWLTGFKFGVVNPKNNVLRATLYAYDDEMADKIEEGLQAVTDNNGKWNGFTKYKAGETKTDFYIRTGNKFSVVWKDAGYLNFGLPQEEQPIDPENPTL